ncbi:MAG: DNA polymerase IV [Ruminococcaceae bacterium]|nr:DNA polymerase IV [Oscillospiraceae bacterium]
MMRTEKVNRDRIILHCDLNNFFASVECVLNPELKDKYVAVCGSEADRRGIVLAKNEKAKACGVMTAEPIWRAKRKCPELVTVPPHHELYREYSQKVQDIYYRYTDQVEPASIDECFLDVTGSTALFGSGEEIAYSIKDAVKKELGLTISVGVSFCKIFAKLGSDMKKPDAVTCITKEHFKQKVWILPVGDLVGVGRSSCEKLNEYGICTIGELAAADENLLQRLLGINGVQLKQFANGIDERTVSKYGEKEVPKSIGHGITTPADLTDNDGVWKVILSLSAEIGSRLRDECLAASGVCVSVKDNTMKNVSYRQRFKNPTQSPTVIANGARDVFEKKHKWLHGIRTVTVTAVDLTQPGFCMPDMFGDYIKDEKIEKIDSVVDSLRRKYGNDSVKNAVLIDGSDNKE